ncbi:MAG: hypothetical protein FJ135_11305 [Deltaproteobacteria bacterium]|nr:hypothetical protein [Deltaproteobacteria bacterium]
MRTILFLASLLVGVFAPDIHKLFLSVIAFLMGKSVGLIELYGRLGDIIVASVILSLLLIVVIFNFRSIRSLMNIPSLLMVVLGLLMTISLIEYSDELSRENYVRFMGGNLLLFFAALFFCRTPETIKRVWNVWIMASIILALISIYVFMQGITWSSGRSMLFPGTGIRSGYFCALSVVYLMAGLLFDSKSDYLFWKLGITGLCMVGILLSGAKAAFLLATGFLILLYGANFVLIKKRKKIAIILSVFTVIIASAIFFKSIMQMQEEGITTGYLAHTFDSDSYGSATSYRMGIHETYLNIGMKDIFFGSGISAIYTYECRTHSLLMAFFVQLGLIGVTIYLLFLAGVLLNGLSLVRKMISRGHLNGLVVSCFLSVIFLAMKGEVTGDVAGNRELWLFSGMLLGLGSPAVHLQGFKRRRFARRRHIAFTAGAGVARNRVAAPGTFNSSVRLASGSTLGQTGGHD